MPSASSRPTRRRPDARAAFPVVVASILVAALVPACEAGPPPPPVPPPAPPAAVEPIAWVEGFSPAIFERAAREQRLVLLHLGAVWCHWCHVMEETTYRDPTVAAIVRESFVAVHVDSDARPDIANRYEEYGWPATVLFDATGRELAKFRGYVPPPRMISLLRAFVADPTPGPSAPPEAEVRYGADAALAPDLRAELGRRHEDGYDGERGGWGRVHKFVDADTVEWALLGAFEGDAGAAQRARETLDLAARWLVDPVFGGVYQYSDGGRWESPHFEKIMSTQAGALRVYSLAYALWGDPAHLAAAQAVVRYLRDFLTSPEGAFYTSQDADVVRGEHSAGYFALDDAGRRARGIPAVDTHTYARENGWAIEALCDFHAATGDPDALARAAGAARWAVANRAIESTGGFRHDERDAAGPYLADTLAMGRAFLALHAVTGEREWLARARAAAGFLISRFANREDPGFATVALPAADAPAAGPFAPTMQQDENVAAARFFNLLHRYTGDGSYRAAAHRAARYLATPAIARSRPISVGGILLADRELATEPLHVCVIGPKDDARARALHAAALRAPVAYRRIEWWDRREGPLPNRDVEYPPVDAPAAFVCAGGACSPPIRDPEKLRSRLERR